MKQDIVKELFRQNLNKVHYGYLEKSNTFYVHKGKQSKVWQ